MSNYERVFIKESGATVAELQVQSFESLEGGVVTDLSLWLQDNGRGVYLGFTSGADSSGVEEALREADTLITLLEKYKDHIKKIVGEQ